jgi:hypothetical protein
VKALPLWQPWASLVAVEAKRLETRSWPVPRGLIGKRIAIHATKTPAHLPLVGIEPFARRLLEALEAGTLVEVDEHLPLGFIVATAVIDRCDPITLEFRNALYRRDPDEGAFGDYTPGRFAWTLRDVECLDPPVPFRGSQGMFDVPNELLGRPAEPTHEQGALL